MYDSLEGRTPKALQFHPSNKGLESPAMDRKGKVRRKMGVHQLQNEFLAEMGDYFINPSVKYISCCEWELNF